MVHRLVSRHPWRFQAAGTTTTATTITTTTRSTATARRHFCAMLSTSSTSSTSKTITIRPSRVLLTASLVHAHHHVATSSRLYYPPSRHLRLLSTLGDSQLRKNKVDVQMLHPELHSKVFPASKPTKTATAASSGLPSAATSSMEPTADMIKVAIGHLEKQNLWGKEAIPVPNTTFHLPPLRGPTIEDHFYNIGKLESEVYQDLATTFARSSVHTPPKEWLLQEGWTRYGKDGSVSRVPFPQEKMLTFDVETVPALSKYPVMACAISPDAWYGWVSPWLINPLTKDGRQNDHHLLSFGPSRNRRGDERILVGHNVGYDRARVLEEYCLEQNGMRYLDTMSLHIAASGLCTQQRHSWLKYSKAIENEDEAYINSFKDTTGKYFDVSAVNSLLQVSKFHCGINMDKAPRDILMEATNIGLIQENFQELMTYCGQDVVATHSVYQQTLPKYLATCPHPVSFAGILQMGSSFLTVNEGWTAYVTRCNKMYREMAENVESKLLLLAQNALENFERDPEFYRSDPWLSQLDWTLPKRRWTKGKLKVDGQSYLKNQEPRLVCMTKIMPDKPQWYRALWDPEDKRIKLSTRQRVAPLLLKLQWRGFPLVHSQLHGWSFRVPREDEFTSKLDELTFPAETEVGYQETIDIKDYRYYRLPHKSGEGTNVGNPLAKGYISYFEDNVLSSFAGEGGSVEDGSGQLARQALDMNAQCAYWVSARERIEDQFVVWDKGVDGLGEKMQLPDREGEGRTNGIILPQIITMGTVTRRAVERTWMTASNAKKNRIGSELKSMVEAPAGYKIVGADVDSEELWISSLMGDAQFRMHGATALGWMTLQGTKAAGTDLHSKTAQILGISRDQAKIFNYGRIYGAGVTFAARLMQQFNSAIDAVEAKARATNLYTATKGIKQHKAPEYELVHDRPFWHGGTESYMFNSLERTATADDPRTPALGCGITDALKPKHTETQFMTSRVNWVVQSSGVDYLHMLLVSMNYLIKKYDIKARFMLCVHDEVRYMVKEEDTARATLALQVSNLWTRAMFSYKLGIHDLPQSVAFFSSVDVDHVFRKEVNMDCLTPTQPVPIPHGQSLTIEGVLDLTDGGKLGPVVEGFEEAAEDSIPFELLSKDQQQKLLMQQSQQRSPVIQEITDAAEGNSAVVSTASQDDAEERNSIFLQAQSLSTMKDIKRMIKQRQAAAEAAYKAKVAAERKKLAEEERASRGAAGGDDGGEGGETVNATRRRTVTTGATTPKPRKPRVVREAAPYARSRPKSTKGTWGQVAAQMQPEPELGPKVDVTELVDALQQETTTGGILSSLAGSPSGPNVEQEIVSSDRVKGGGLSSTSTREVTVAFVKAQAAKEEDEDMTGYTFEDILPETQDAASLDDAWTLPTEEWLTHFTKDYGAPLAAPTSPRESELVFKSEHLPHILPSPVDVARETTLQEPSLFMSPGLSSFVRAGRSGSADGRVSVMAGATAAASSGYSKPSRPMSSTSNSMAMAGSSSTTTVMPVPSPMARRAAAAPAREYEKYQHIKRQQKAKEANIDTVAMRSGNRGSDGVLAEFEHPRTTCEVIPRTEETAPTAAGGGDDSGGGGVRHIVSRSGQRSRITILRPSSASASAFASARIYPRRD